MTAKKKPVRKKAPAARGSTKPIKRSSVPESERPLILVAEDYEDARELYAEFLEFSGFRVAQAENGLEAVELAMKLTPDLILMDLSMPGLDGWEATRRLKKHEKTKSIPVIALTGHALAGHSEGAKKAGCDAFIAKPCLPDALVAEVRRMLDLKKKPRRPRTGDVALER